MRAIDQLITEDVSPTLEELGFCRSRREFYYVGSVDDVGVLCLTHLPATATSR